MQAFLKNNLKYADLALSLAVLISVIVLFRPGSDGPLPFIYADKVVHFTTFMLLGFTARWRYRQPYKVLAVLFLYAIASELVQHYFIPGREFELADIIFDSLGACFGIGLIGPQEAL